MNKTCVQHYILKDAQALETWVSAHIHYLVTPCVLYLSGPLGAGKTTCCQAILKNLGYKGTIKSPTYTLVETYQLPSFCVHHFDLYRIVDPFELETMGIEEYFIEPAIVLIEWPENAQGHLPKADIKCRLDYHEAGRLLKVSTQSEAMKSAGSS